MTKFKTAIAIAVGTLFAGAAFAQSNYSIEQRDRIAQERIDRSIQSGQLTSREAARLESERAQVERLERRARADGVLSQYERARIDRAQDRLGRDIYRESHDRQVANSNWRTSDRPQGWDHRNEGWDRRNEGWNRRNDNDQRHFDRGVRPGQFNHREAVRGGRNESHVNGARFGRSEMAPGRQPHLWQSETQRTQVQRAQTQRSWTRPAQTSSLATTASPAVQQATTQRSWTRPARTGSLATTASPAVQQATTQRSWTRPARNSSTASTGSTGSTGSLVTVARQGGYSGRHTR